MIIPCFLLSGSGTGSLYGVTTRSQDKWITSGYAHRTEINSVAIVSSRRVGEKAEETEEERVEKSTSPTYPVGVVGRDRAQNGERVVGSVVDGMANEGERG